MLHLELVIPIQHLHIQIPLLFFLTKLLLDVYEVGDELVAHRDVERELYALLTVDDRALDVAVDVGVMRFIVGLNAYQPRELESTDRVEGTVCLRVCISCGLRFAIICSTVLSNYAGLWKLNSFRSITCQ